MSAAGYCGGGAVRHSVGFHFEPFGSRLNIALV